MPPPPRGASLVLGDPAAVLGVVCYHYTPIHTKKPARAQDYKHRTIPGLTRHQSPFIPGKYPRSLAGTDPCLTPTHYFFWGLVHTEA